VKIFHCFYYELLNRNLCFFELLVVVYEIKDPKHKKTGLNNKIHIIYSSERTLQVMVEFNTSDPECSQATHYGMNL